MENTKWLLRLVLGVSFIVSGCMVNPSANEGSTSKDDSAPLLIGVLEDQNSHNSLSQTPPIVWNAASDNAGVSHYEVAIGTSLGGTDVLDWVSVGPVTTIQIDNLALSDLTFYYPSVRAVDISGNISSIINGDGWIVNLAGVIATASGVPTGNSQAINLDITVSGNSITHYKYKLGEATVTDCSVETGYSSEIPISNKISDSIVSINNGTQVKLCVLGKNTYGIYQLASDSTVYQWQKVGVTAIITAPNNGQFAGTGFCTYQIVISGVGVTHYKYSYTSSSSGCATAAYTSVFSVSSSIGYSVSDGNTETLCVLGRNSDGVWQELSSATFLELNCLE